MPRAATRPIVPTSDQPTPPARQSGVDAAALHNARQAVKAPAIGMIVAAGINLAVIFSFLAIVITRTGGNSLPPDVTVKASVAFLTVAVATVLGIIGNVLILLGSMSMMQVRNRGLAITAAILAIIASPGNIIGLPMGIWTLIVLSRREVVEAFAAGRGDETLLPCQAGKPEQNRALRPVLLTLALHGILLLSALAAVLFVAAQSIAVLKDLHIAVPFVTKAAVTLTGFLRNWTIVVLPSLMAVDAGVCCLLQCLAGSGARRWWSLGVSAATGIVAILLAAALLVPFVATVQSLAKPSAPSTGSGPSRQHTASRPGARPQAAVNADLLRREAELKLGLSDAVRRLGPRHRQTVETQARLQDVQKLLAEMEETATQPAAPADGSDR